MFKLHHGDSAVILKQLPDNSVEAIVTDPPSSIAFMGKEWDSNKGGRQQWIDWLAGIMREGLRVLKPGGYALVWSLPRTNHWTATAVEDAGFEIRECLVHLFAQGMPKGLNVAKAIDKKGGDGSAWEGWNSSLKTSSEFWVVARKPLSEKTLADNVLKWGTGAFNIEASRISTNDNLNGGAYAKSGTERDDGWRMQRGGAGEFQQPSGRWPATTVLSHAPGCKLVGKKKVKVSVNHHVSGTSIGGQATYQGGKERLGHDFADEDGNELVDDWECEDGCPIKALDNQSKKGRWPATTVLSHAPGCKLVGTRAVKGGVAVNENRDPVKTKNVYGDYKGMQGSNVGYAEGGKEEIGDWECEDGCPVKALDGQSGVLQSGAGCFKQASGEGYQGNAYGKESRPPGTEMISYGDRGGASRFFKCFEADPFVYQAKASKSEKNAGLDDQNNHPTVKSLKLMEYLIGLICRPGGTVLDMFMGSGSTGVAAVKNGFKFIGIEQEEAYFEISRQRIEAAQTPP